jgi:hypothetical protein
MPLLFAPIDDSVQVTTNYYFIIVSIMYEWVTINYPLDGQINKPAALTKSSMIATFLSPNRSMLDG